MRKIIESTLISLDGVFSNPQIWATAYFDHEAEKDALDLLGPLNLRAFSPGQKYQN
jgi:hypothetical protein